MIMVRRWRVSRSEGFVRPASAKAVSSLHANRQLGGEDAQVRTDLGIEDLSETVVVEFAQSPGKHARQEQSRRELLRRVAGAHSRPLLFHQFADRRCHRLEYTDDVLKLATVKPLIFKDLRIANS